MDAALILKCYPAGIGKHIVCIDAGKAAVLQTACRGEPRTPSNKATGITSGSTAAAEREDN